jgi:hypothetical protein
MAIKHSEQRLAWCEFGVSNVGILHIETPPLHIAHRVLKLGGFSFLKVYFRVGLL